MKRTTTLTIMLMSGSIAAAVAAPGLPGDLAAGGECAEQLLVMPAMSVAAAAAPPVASVRVSAGRDGSQVSGQNTAPECEVDVTEPYRRAHHGSLKLDPICPARAAT